MRDLCQKNGVCLDYRNFRHMTLIKLPMLEANQVRREHLQCVQSMGKRTECRRIRRPSLSFSVMFVTWQIVFFLVTQGQNDTLASQAESI